MPTTGVFEFHVSRAARNRYSFADALFSFNGNVVFANPVAAREFANRINTVRGTLNDPTRAVRASDLYAMGLIDEALHALVQFYRKSIDQNAISGALKWYEEQIGGENLELTLNSFVRHFPPTPVYKGELSPEQWLSRSTNEFSHREVALEELMMLWLSNANPAFEPGSELFDDTPLKDSAYRKIVAGFTKYFAGRPKYGSRGLNLVDVLRAPALRSPGSLAGQLAYLREEFGGELASILDHILTALGVIKEEEVAIWSMFHPVDQQHHHFGLPLDMGDSSIAAIPHFSPKEPEYERFSADVEWMPSTVLLAKSVHVWLDQLSRQYGRHIHRLDHVPEEELALMSRRGFNSLWLIGVWERSTASRRIKQMMGNQDAAASAYSLFDYRIADDLGGQSAYENLRERATRHGIRLASDMVPNHMGIDSQWVMDHPDWFLSLPHSPYPAYTFDGPDLSEDGRVEVKLEDHYYNHSDAAVVFRRIDRWTGETRYIYHGNDGTTFPWNDTAQLNYLNPEVREAVIQTIIHVARMFPIIRFDAAMTLTKQHFQRLWFPAPGTGGAIPSRAEHGLTKPQFDQLMPNEFWREVVDRIAVEVPGTLLLAEAFWLLEGYFVRTLGMHRVYNSAFMNMLRDEENANYRSVLKNTLEFDPDVLKRYVNFMNNPDERTAVDQFGKGDKYFGICTMLATLPGLPMFGHGQIEGYTERYGMEFRRAQRDEQPDSWLIGRHEREITPLLHRRPMFAEVKDFLLYDFFTDYGSVNEDVFAYSNRLGDDRALVIFQNRYAHTSGWIRMSCGYVEKHADGSKQMKQRSIGEAFGLDGDHNHFVACRDVFNGQEFLHRSSDLAEKGLHITLGAYEHHVLLDWRDLRDDATHNWSGLCNYLAGRGVPSLEEALRQFELKPLHDTLVATVGYLHIDLLVNSSCTPEMSALLTKPPAASEANLSRNIQIEYAVDTVTRQVKKFFEECAHFVTVEAKRNPSEFSDNVIRVDEATEAFRGCMNAAIRIPGALKQFVEPCPQSTATVLPSDGRKPAQSVTAAWAAVVSWAMIAAVAETTSPADPMQFAVALFDKAHLRHAIADALENLGIHGEDRWRAAARIRFAFAHRAVAQTSPALTKSEIISRTSPQPQLSWLHDPEVSWLIGTNEHQGVRYFNKELFEQLMWWTAVPLLIEALVNGDTDGTRVREIEHYVKERCRKAEKSGYKIEALLASDTESVL